MGRSFCTSGCRYDVNMSQWFCRAVSLGICGGRGRWGRRSGGLRGATGDSGAMCICRRLSRGMGVRSRDHGCRTAGDSWGRWRTFRKRPGRHRPGGHAFIRTPIRRDTARLPKVMHERIAPIMPRAIRSLPTRGRWRSIGGFSGTTTMPGSLPLRVVVWRDQKVRFLETSWMSERGVQARDCQKARASCYG